jgi:hypothetical protein
MNEEKIQQLKDALKEIMAMIVQRGQPLTPELKDMLFQVMQHVASRIEELRAEGEAPPTAAVASSQIEPSGPSSNVEGFAYDPKTNKLMVRFLGDYPNKNGPIYSYDKVPPQIFDLLRQGAVPARSDGKNKWGKWWKGKTPSFGASVYTLIKNGGYNYRKLA